MSQADEKMRAAERDLELARTELSTQEQKRASLTARCEALRSAVADTADDSVGADRQEGTLDNVIRVRPGATSGRNVARSPGQGQGAARRCERARVLGGIDADRSVRLVLPGTRNAVASHPDAALNYIEAPDHLRGAVADAGRGGGWPRTCRPLSASWMGSPMYWWPTIDGQMLGQGIAAQGSEAPTSSLCATRWSRRPRVGLHRGVLAAGSGSCRQGRSPGGRCVSSATRCATRWPPSRRRQLPG